MPDNIAPYPDMPGDTLPSPQAVAVDRGNAQWAKTFEGGTTNLATRARHAADIRQYAGDLEAQRVQQQADLLARNKDAQNFYLKERALTLQEKKANFDMEDKRQKADAAVALAPTMLAAKKAQTEALIARTKSLADEQAANAAIETQAANVRSIVARAKPFVTPDQLDEVYHAAATENPGAVHDKDIGPQIIQARKNLDLARKQSDITAKATAAGLTPNLVTESGLETFHSKTAPAPSDPELTALKRTLGSAVAKQATADNTTKDVFGHTEAQRYQPGIDRLKATIAEKDGVASPAPAKAASSSDYIKSKLGQ